jgi:predicted metal-dependent RNase
MSNNENNSTLKRQLSPMHVWAIAFGCVIGWGSFINPGKKFLPNSGVAGTAIAMVLGALVMIIIAASGMCEGGRVVHHLKNCVADPDNVVLIVGFQAENTLGRRVVERRNPLKVLGEEVELKARVEVINALSAHADRAGLTDWIDEVKDNVRHAFAIHGEPEKVSAMVELLKDRGVANAVAPMPGQTYRFD